jgi:hypothetical protein
MLIRFVVSELDPTSGRRQGLFQAAERLRESDDLEPGDRDQLERLGVWFNENLEKPLRLAMSPRPHRKAQAISWFKDSARAHIAKMRELEEVLGRYGAAVQFIKTSRVGYVVYEDQFQVVACPFGDTPA